MPIHIGKEIEKVSKQKRIRAAELGKMISKTRQNVNDIYGRKTIDGDLLLSISRVLNFDFFQLYSEEYKFLTGLDSAQHGNWADTTKVQDPQEEYRKKEDNLRQYIQSQASTIEMQQKVISLLEEKVAKQEQIK